MTDWMAEHRTRQGLPPTIEDQTVLARLATLIQLARLKDNGVQQKEEHA